MRGDQIELFALPDARIEAFIKIELEPKLAAETQFGQLKRRPPPEPN